MHALTDIAIVGAGAVGCALACALAQANPGLHITVLEASPEIAAYAGQRYDPRVYALSAASIELLQSLSVWEGITAARACPYHRMRVWDGQSVGAIEFSRDEVHTDYLGYIVEHAVLVSALRQRMASLPNVHLRAPVTLKGLLRKPSAEGVRLELEDGSTIEALIAVGADGAQSQVRRLADFQVRRWNYGQSALITTVKTEQAHQCTARQCFTEHGALAFLPLGEGPQPWTSQYHSIVWSLDDEVARDYLAMPQAEFHQRLEKAFEGCLGAVTESDERHLIPLYQMHAVDYVQPCIALVGDAAHNIHPLAGQGVNLGFYDARAFCAEVARAVERRIPLYDPSVLKRYARQRKPHNLAAMAAMEGFKRLFETRNGWMVALRSTGLQWTAQQAWLKRWFIRMAAGSELG